MSKVSKITEEELSQLNAFLQEKSTILSKIGSLSASHLIETQNLINMSNKEEEYKKVLGDEYGDISIET
jgi:hypothetical protein